MIDNSLFDCREELKRLQAEAAAMREALHPFAALYHKRLDDLDDDAPLYQHCGALITVGDVRRAKAALAADVGRELPERLRRAERERDEARARLLSLAEMSRK
jgi:chaperonin cofactor prefoldin